VISPFKIVLRGFYPTTAGASTRERQSCERTALVTPDYQPYILLMGNAVHERDFLTGQTLIAMPNMGDPRFERSVILICSHQNDHAMGIVINKTIKEVTIGELLKQLEINADKTLSSSPVFYGGPVQQDQGLVIHTLDYKLDETLIVNDNIGVTGTREILANVASKEDSVPRPDRYLLALGHAGWSGGQLEEEIQMNAWAHCEALEDIVFSGNEKRRSVRMAG